MIIGRIDEGVSRLERSRVLLAAYAVLMLVQLAAPVSGAANGSTRSTQASCTPVNPADFPSVPSITNPYLPMAPGQSSVFGGTSNDRPSQNVIFITHKTKVIMGVTTLVANDTGTIKGKLTEMTFDY